MENLDYIFFINLERRPDRKEHFLKQCVKHDLPFEKIIRFDAIDGTTYEFEERHYKMFEDATYINKPFAKKIMGNQLSHYHILKHMVKEGYQNILVLQDDAVFRPDFVSYLENIMKNIPHDAQIINIGLHKFAAEATFVPWDFSDPTEDEYIIEKPVNDSVCYWNRNINPCSLAYIVTTRGAKKLVEYFDKVGFKEATDRNFNDYLVNRRVFYGSTRVLVTTNMQFDSDIFL